MSDTPVATCPACDAKRRHTAEDWLNHPDAGTGCHSEHGKTGAPQVVKESQE